MANPVTPLIAQLEHPADLNLDGILESLREAALAFDRLQKRTALSEYELQRELRALIELIGPTPVCSDPEVAHKLTGDSLVLARRDAKRRYNDLFRIAPVRKI